MNILHISAECYPAAKVGGLADVAAALPKYMNKAGHKAELIMPYYNNKFFRDHSWEVVRESDFNLGVTAYPYRILKEKTDTLGFTLFTTEIPGLLTEEFPYGYWNDVQRHLGFQIAVADWLSHTSDLPDVIHCHDHHSGLLPFMIDYCFRYNSLKDIPTVFTIHNGSYHGAFSRDQSSLIPPFDNWKTGMLEWTNAINPMASAIKCCWRFTTVSRSYLQELQQYALGLESLIVSERQKSLGILNGIDTELWDPATDSYLEKNYTTDTVTSGKIKNKSALCEEFGLDPEKMLVVFIGRLVSDKGADLLPESIIQSVSEYEDKVNFIVLGSGDGRLENNLTSLAATLPASFQNYIGYNEKLAHLIYGGADFLLMPSRVEPCGLNQLYALRYGTIPIVTATGGLKDTVLDLAMAGGFGIRFEEAVVRNIVNAIGRAVLLFEDEEKFSEIRKQIMTIDHSWQHAVKEYLDLYSSMK
ncbi:MAG: glycogen/starch synthase [Chitinophagales bacterium]|nr:glycogen/starch synthase [Chitinophagales bacterium]